MKKRSLIDIRNVDVSLGCRKILHDISWRLRNGEHWAVVGPNGAGKSTFLRLIRGDIWPDPSNSGKRIYRFGRGAQESPVDIKQKIAFVSPERQDAYTRNNWELTGSEVIHTGFSDSVYLHGKPRKREIECAKRIISSMNLEDLRDKKVINMSEGEARKILIARALASRPRVLILDEFSSGLDISAREQMFGMIGTIARSGTQVIYTTHRIEELIPSISHVVLMNSGKITKQGEIGNVLNGEGMTGPKGKNVKSSGRLMAPESLHRPNSNGAYLIRIRNADVYLNGMKVLDGISWRIRRCENWAILGKNGAGKSTLVKLLRGDLHPALGGDVSRSGDQRRVDLWEFRKKTGYVSSELQANYDEPLTVREVVQSGFFSSIGLYVKVNHEQKKAAEKWIQFFRLDGIAGIRVNSISYGEMRRTLVARAMVNNPDILVLDEPCSGMDIRTRSEFLRTLEKMAKDGTGMIFVTHHPEDLIPSITHVLIMDKGRIVFSGGKRDVPLEMGRYFGLQGSASQ
jgi:molybdate transport system ATP-binding protein